MARKQKKTRAETSAEDFFPVEQRDIKYAVEKVEKILEPEIEKIEQVGKKIIDKITGKNKKTAKKRGDKKSSVKTKARKGDFSKKYYDVLISLVKGAGSITVATDYDIEGEVIGLNVVRFIAGQEDAARMKFSTLTDKELKDSYETK